MKQLNKIFKNTPIESVCIYFKKKKLKLLINIRNIKIILVFLNYYKMKFFQIKYNCIYNFKMNDNKIIQQIKNHQINKNFFLKKFNKMKI